MNTISNLINSRKYLRTYAIGLLQTKAYRTLKQKTNLALKQFGIGSVAWAFLGVLYENPKGMGLSSLAEELDVEASFVTEIGGKMKKKNFLLYSKDEKDARAKSITLTKEGRDFVEKVEKNIRAEAKTWIKGVSIKEALAYIKVLERIIDTDSKNEIK